MVCYYASQWLLVAHRTTWASDPHPTRYVRSNSTPPPTRRSCLLLRQEEWVLALTDRLLGLGAVVC